MVQVLAGERGQVGVVAAAGDGQLGLLRHLVHEADAAGTEDATFLVEDHRRPEVDLLAAPARTLGVDEAMISAALVILAHLVVEAAFMPTLTHVVLLQGAFAGLVADRAIQRVVHQQEFHHALAQLDDLLAADLGPDLEARGGLHVARDTQGPAPGTFGFHQTDATVARHRQILVITERRCFHLGELPQPFDELDIRGDLDIPTVDIDGNEICHRGTHMNAPGASWASSRGWAWPGFRATYSSNDLRNFLMNDRTGQAAPGANAQMVVHS